MKTQYKVVIYNEKGREREYFKSPFIHQCIDAINLLVRMGKPYNKIDLLRKTHQQPFWHSWQEAEDHGSRIRMTRKLSN